MNDESWLHELQGHHCSFEGKCETNEIGCPDDGTASMQISRFNSVLEENNDGLQWGSPQLESRQFESVNPRRRLSPGILMQLFLLAIITLITPSTAAIVNFGNCLGPIIINSPQLQFKPLFVNATFNSTAASHNLNITVYGDVMGTTNGANPPDRSDPQWSNPNETIGKIPDLGPSNTYTTLKTSFNVLDYTPYTAPSRFCESTLQQPCPMIPTFVKYP